MKSPIDVLKDVVLNDRPHGKVLRDIPNGFAFTDGEHEKHAIHTSTLTTAQIQTHPQGSMFVLDRPKQVNGYIFFTPSEIPFNMLRSVMAPPVFLVNELDPLKRREYEKFFHRFDLSKFPQIELGDIQVRLKGVYKTGVPLIFLFLRKHGAEYAVKVTM